MQKIIAGIVGLALVAGVSTQAARALFTTSAQVNGINITAGTAVLEVSGSNDPVSFTNNLNANLNIENIYPGFEAETPFFIRNNGTADIDLNLTARLTAATGWPNLSNEVEMNIKYGAQESGFKTLAAWNNVVFTELPGPDLPVGEAREYLIQMRVPESVGNSIAGLSLTNITFTIEGTQVIPTP